MGTLILGCAFAVVVATAALVSSCLRLRSTVGTLLAVYLLTTTEIVVVSSFTIEHGYAAAISCRSE